MRVLQTTLFGWIPQLPQNTRRQTRDDDKTDSFKFDTHSNIHCILAPTISGLGRAQNFP